MKQLIEMISQEIKEAFTQLGYDEKYGEVTLSNRPDLCQYQCNGALAAAKEYRKAPFLIADEVVAKLADSKTFKEITMVRPGFININVAEEFLARYVQNMKADVRYGIDKDPNPKKIVIDYGGPNVAKPLHVGHLRSAVIGESIKRIARFMGHDVVGDVHLGDWGLQMGLIIMELKKRKPELVYFDDSFTGEYPKEAPFTISELEEIYPAANAYSKDHPEFREAAKEATNQLQQGKPGYRAIWNHIIEISVTDLKKNYKNLNVEFDLWNGESDVQDLIPGIVAELKDKGLAYLSDGALVVDVKEEEDTKEIPPCMILKSDGSAIYATTDIATLVERMNDFHPDEVKYVVDKRQDLHFMQVFRCCRKAGIVEQDTKLTFLGFGTMNGKDGKPFKTRDGGVMRLENLIAGINEEVYKKMMSNREMDPEEAKEIAKTIGLAALKYGDLSNQASKDYVFDIDRFTSFEGNTGPYILYTIVRIKSILNKYKAMQKEESDAVLAPASASETDLMLELAKVNGVVQGAYEDNAPHRICQYIYDLSNAFNRFYHENKILAEENQSLQASWINLIVLTKDILVTCIDLLGFSAPDRM